MSRSVLVLLALYLVTFCPSVMGAGFRFLRPEIPLLFEENRGQSPREFRYVLTHYNSGFSCEGLFSRYSDRPRRVFAQFRFAGANASCPAELTDPAGSWSHFYRGQRKSASEENVRHFRQLVFRNVWPGVDIRYTASVSDEGAYVATFTGRSAADIARVRIAFSNYGSFDGSQLWTDLGPLALGGPVTVDMNEGDGVFAFRALPGAGSGAVTFTLTVPVARIAVPTLRFTVDTDRNIYTVAGTTTYPELDGTAAACIQSSITNACPDIYVAKFSNTGTLQYLVYLQGRRYDAGYQIEVDRGGNVYVAGTTLSADFVMTAGVYQESFAGPDAPEVEARFSVGGDAFLAKLHGPTGGLIYSTLIGRSAAESVYGMRVDDYGRSYMIIGSRSTDFPIKGPVLEEAPACGTSFVAPTSAPTCRFLVSLDENGRELGYSLKTSAESFSISPWGAVYYVGSVNYRAEQEPFESFVQSLWPDGTSRYRASLGRAAQLQSFPISPTPGDSLSLVREIRSSTGTLTGAELLRLGPNGEITGAARIPMRIDLQPFGLQNDEAGASWILSPSTPSPNAPLAFDCATCPGVTALDSSGNVLFATYLPTAPYLFRVAGGLVYFPETVSNAVGPTLTILDRAANPVPLLARLTDPSGDSLPFVPGNIITALGAQIGPAVHVQRPLDVDGRLATAAGGVRVLLDGTPAPILSASEERIVFQVPLAYKPGSKTSTLAIEQDGAPVLTRPLGPNTGRGLLVVSGRNAPDWLRVRNEDGSLNGPDSPASPGSVVGFFVAGVGATDVPLVQGELDHAVLAKPLVRPEVRFGLDQEPAEVVSYAQAADQLAGIMEMRARLPEDPKVDSLPIVFVVDGLPYLQSEPARVFVRR
jgi:uncharacterized protein (TIGR03437 family)